MCCSLTSSNSSQKKKPELHPSERVSYCPVVQPFVQLHALESTRSLSVGSNCRHLECSWNLHESTFISYPHLKPIADQRCTFSPAKPLGTLLSLLAVMSTALQRLMQQHGLGQEKGMVGSKNVLINGITDGIMNVFGLEKKHYPSQVHPKVSYRFNMQDLTKMMEESPDMVTTPPVRVFA